MEEKTNIEKLFKDTMVLEVGVETNIFDSLNLQDKDEYNKSLQRIIFDFSNELSVILKALELFYEVNTDETVEIINRYNQMYIFSGTKILEKILFKICTESNISTNFKIECAKSLCVFQNDKNDKNDKNIKSKNCYIALDKVCQNLENIPTPIKIDAICMLAHNDDFKENSIKYFCNIIVDKNIDCDFRYKTILGLENKKNLEYLFKESCIKFLNDIGNMTSYRILAAQILLVKFKDSDLLLSLINNIQDILLSFAKDNDLDYNLRADSADVLLRYSKKDSSVFLEAQDIIILLGRDSSSIVKTVFNNAQNVHVLEIEESVSQAIEFLSSIELMIVEENCCSKEYITYEYVKKQIECIINESDMSDKTGKADMSDKTGKADMSDKINISMNRIYMDRALYSKYNCSLVNILLKVWTYLSGHESESTMKDRLLEELVEMSGTCSSGYASRLVNVISGFGDFNIRISWKDQIVSNFSGRLNARIKNITNPENHISNDELGEIYFLLFYEYNDKKINIKEKTVSEFCSDKCIENIQEEIREEYQNRILCEMLIPPSNYNNRRHFLKFFRSNLSSIRQEMYLEFSGLISDTDYDLWFRSAISSYEGF